MLTISVLTLNTSCVAIFTHSSILLGGKVKVLPYTLGCLAGRHGNCSVAWRYLSLIPAKKLANPWKKLQLEDVVAMGLAGT
jgi:hypothetical protein